MNPEGTIQKQSAVELITEVRSWAGLLASESRDPNWITESYVPPVEINHLLKQLTSMHGGLIGIVGFQGVGKSSALLSLSTSLNELESVGSHTLLFKWRRTSNLFRSLFNYNHEVSLQYLSEYNVTIKKAAPPDPRPQISSASIRAMQLRLERQEAKFPWAVRVEGQEKKLGKMRTERLRQITWIDLLRNTHTIFVDMPDYSKSDHRAMAKDFEEIYWLWNSLCATNPPHPNLVIAIQKEMFRGHFFLDKMQKFELHPLPTELMIKAYKHRFKTAEPFTDDALLTLARMSRGIFRRFLRYITLTLDRAETASRTNPIGVETVKDAVTTERLAEDMELELQELFPRHSELRFLAVRLLMYLGENGPQKQNQLSKTLDTKDYALSRVLAKLEGCRYVVRGRDGADKVVCERKMN